jgi:orotidine-5'-phosphate decarboxylase
MRARWAVEAGCAGVVCSGREASLVRAVVGPGAAIVTPGIRPTWQADAHDQRRVVTPAEAIGAGADYLVVGRPIRDAADPGAAAGRIVEEISRVASSSR